MAASVFREAKRLYDLGFAIIWIKPKSKMPVEMGWTTGPRQNWQRLKETYKDGYNVGVRCGAPSNIMGNYLACIDVDVKDPKYRATCMEYLKKLVGKNVMPQVLSGSGGGSRHLYCVTKTHFKMLTMVKEKGKFEICVYSDGRQMVLPPSIHPDTNRHYIWKLNTEDEFSLPLMDFEKYQGGDPENRGNGGSSGLLRPETWEKSAKPKSDKPDSKPVKFDPVEVDLEWLDIDPKILKGIKDGEGVDDRSAFLLPATESLIRAGLSENEILSALTDKRYWLSKCGYDHAQSNNRQRAAKWLWRYSVKPVVMEHSPKYIFKPVTSEGLKSEPLSKAQLEAQNKEFMEMINWQDDLDKTKTGSIKATLKNLDLIFTNEIDEALFIKDEFANKLIYGAKPPWDSEINKTIEDIDLILAKRWLAENFGFEPNTSTVLEAISLIGHKRSIHPVREYLESLKWDGKSRINTWIKDYCQGEADEPYLSEVSRKFLVAMVKRVFEPGCQWDYVLVLEGKQGRYKSSIARALASDKWFMDNLPDLKDKDAMLNLQGKWLIELGELADVKRTDYNLVKAYLVRRTDTVRPHYGRLQIEIPRQSVFIGTINDGQYLKDPTGNRRYWPVRVGMCDVKGLTAVRDQLFAEAYMVYRQNTEILTLDREAVKQATEAQENRRVDDDETEMRDLLIDYLNSNEPKEIDFGKFKTRDLIFGANAPWARFSNKQYVMQTAAVVLGHLGFLKTKCEGQRVWRMTGEVKSAFPHLPTDFMIRETKPIKTQKRAGQTGQTPASMDFC